LQQELVTFQSRLVNSLKLSEKVREDARHEGREEKQ
jgi:hypothetical protein